MPVHKGRRLRLPAKHSTVRRVPKRPALLDSDQDSFQLPRSAPGTQGAARRMRTGQVEVKWRSAQPDGTVRWLRAAGNRREFGKFGLEEFLEVKSLQL
jgi:hypothetical protein